MLQNDQIQNIPNEGPFAQPVDENPEQDSGFEIIDKESLETEMKHVK